jgi:hypothetical protein
VVRILCPQWLFLGSYPNTEHRVGDSTNCIRTPYHVSKQDWPHLGIVQAAAGTFAGFVTYHFLERTSSLGLPGIGKDLAYRYSYAALTACLPVRFQTIISDEASYYIKGPILTTPRMRWRSNVKPSGIVRALYHAGVDSTAVARQLSPCRFCMTLTATGENSKAPGLRKDRLWRWKSVSSHLHVSTIASLLSDIVAVYSKVRLCLLIRTLYLDWPCLSSSSMLMSIHSMLGYIVDSGKGRDMHLSVSASVCQVNLVKELYIRIAVKTRCT